MSYPETGFHAFTGNFGHLLDLSFDVFSTLGSKLSMQLNLALSTNEANILTDTTLSSLSGETVSFQDTDTYRYRDLEVVEGEEKKTGVTREVTAGLIVTIKGWASGNGMITMEVDATISKRGVDTSANVAALPPTTEKKVASRVRTYSGKPVILSGLYRWDTSTSVSKTPILGDIPILGLLFQKRAETKTKSEIVIYIMPHIEVAEEPPDKSRQLERLYHNLFLSAVRKES